jgi:eukaryotic-like serine/threonine-protein kinase
VHEAVAAGADGGVSSASHCQIVDGALADAGRSTLAIETYRRNTVAADRDLLFGLLALQTGLIQQAQLVAAFHAWTCDKSRSLGDHLMAMGHLDATHRPLLEGLAAAHLARHDGDVEKSLAAAAGRSTRESLASLGDPDVNATLAHLAAGHPSTDDGDGDRTASYAVGTASSDGLRFRVLRPHARGGLGAVFVALDAELHREVALKQILDEHADDPMSRQRFVIEAEITGGLEHPGIVPVYGLGSYGDGRPFYAMRFIRGDSLKEAIQRYHVNKPPNQDAGSRSLELRKLLRRFLDVCNAIEYAHSRGVLHRDIKPGNVIVGKHGETLVVDWGLAKATGRAEPSIGERTLVPASTSGSAVTLPGSALGTPAYMSPEQAEGNLERLGPYSDVYSLGATLYHLLTGRAPFEGSPAEVIPAVQKGAFRPPHALDPSLDRALAAVCMKAMAHTPADRYATPKSLAEDLERWMADEPVIAFAEPVVSRARRWARRHPRLVTGWTASIVAAAVGLTAITVVVSSSNRRLADANRTVRGNLERIAEQNRELERSGREVTQARSAAVQERDQAREVTAFLVSTFRKPDPDMDGRDVKVAQVLKDAAKSLEGKSSMAPLTRAAILAAIGETYGGLGLSSDAAEVFERVHSIRRQALGTDHLDTVASLATLSSAYWEAGQFDHAIRLCEQVLEIRRSKLGHDHPLTLSTLNDLAVTYEDAGQLDRALELFQQALQAHRTKLGENHLDTVLVMHNLGDAYLVAGQPERAVPMLEKAVAVYRESKGARDSATLEMTNNLARAYAATGQHARALALHEEILQARVGKLGPDHTLTLTSMNNVAVECLSLDQPKRAIVLLEQVLAMRRAESAVRHVSILDSMNNLALAYQSTSQLDRAIPLYEEALAGHQAKLGQSHFKTLNAQRNLASAYEAAGRLQDAERQYRQVIETAGRNQPRNDRFWAESLARLGGCLIRQNRPAEALPILRQSLEIKMKILPDQWSTAEAQGLLGQALVGVKDLAAAEPLLLASQKALAHGFEAIPPLERERVMRAACDRLISLYEASDKPTEAERWRRQRPPSKP